MFHISYKFRLLICCIVAVSGLSLSKANPNLLPQDTLIWQSLLTYQDINQLNHIVDSIYYSLDIKDDIDFEEMYNTMKLSEVFNEIDLEAIFKRLDWNQLLGMVNWNYLMGEVDWDQMIEFMCDTTNHAKIALPDSQKMDQSLLESYQSFNMMECISMDMTKMMSALDQKCLMDLMFSGKMDLKLAPGNTQAICSMAECIDFGAMFGNTDWNCLYSSMDLNAIFSIIDFQHWINLWENRQMNSQDSIMAEYKNEVPFLQAINLDSISKYLVLDFEMLRADENIQFINNTLRAFIQHQLQSTNDPKYLERFALFSFAIMKKLFGDSRALRYYSIHYWLILTTNLKVQNLSFEDALHLQQIQKDIIITAYQEGLIDQLNNDTHSVRKTIGVDFEANSLFSILQNLGTTYLNIGNWDSALNFLKKAVQLKASQIKEGLEISALTAMLNTAFDDKESAQIKQSYHVTDEWLKQFQYLLTDNQHPSKIDSLIAEKRYEEAIQVYLVMKDMLFANIRNNSLFESLPLRNEFVERVHGLKMVKGLYQNLVNLMDTAKLEQDKRYLQFKRAPALLKTFEAKQMLVLLYLQLGRTYFMINNFELSEKYLEQAWDIARRMPNLDYIAVVQPGIGDFKKDFLDKTPIYVYLANTLAALYVSMQQYQKAEDRLLQIKDVIAHKETLNTGLSKTQIEKNLFAIYGSLGEVALLQKNQAKAYHFFHTCKGIANLSNNALLKYQASIRLAYYHQINRQLDSALHFFQHAQVEAQAINYKDGITETLIGMGSIAQIKKDSEQALLFYDQAEKLAKNNGAYNALYKLNNYRGELYQKTGDFNKALSAFDRSIRVVEDSLLRNFYQGAHSRQMILENAFSAYSKAIDCTLQIGQSEKTFEYVQQIKARTLNDLLFEGASRSQKIEPELKQERNRLIKQLSEIPVQYINAKPDSITILQRKFLRQLEIVNTAIKEKTGVNATTYVPTIKEIQQQLSKGEAILEFFLTKEKVLAFVIRKNAYEVKYIGERATLDLSIKEFLKSRDQLSQDPGAIVNSLVFNKRLENIYQNLFPPINQSELLKNSKRLIIIPDDQLYQLPFEALVESNESTPPLIDQHETIHYYPSCTTFYHDRRRSSNVPSFSKDLLLVSMSNYDSTIYQLDNLQAVDETLFQKRFSNMDVLYNKDARTERLLKMDLLPYRYLYISAHGEINDIPELSNLALSDGPLSLYQTFDLNIQSEVVVLSACETARGQFQRGAGLMGFSRGLLYAGAKALVISLWKVEETSSEKLMEFFFANLSDGHPPAKALAQAKQALRKWNNGQYEHPFYWSGFVLFGKGR